MADSLGRRAKKWTYLTWCDLRNHPFMLVGALVGAIAFVIYTINTVQQGSRITTIEKTVKVPRRCQVERLPTFPETVILTCVPATKQEVARAKRHAAHQRAARQRRRAAGVSQGSPAPSGNRNGNRGITPSPSHPQQPSRPPPSSSPSGGGSSPSTPSQPPARGSPQPGVTTPPLGPIPSLTVPLPSPSLPPLPRSGQLTGR